jgi:hypothetical protein
VLCSTTERSSLQRPSGLYAAPQSFVSEATSTAISRCNIDAHPTLSGRRLAGLCAEERTAATRTALIICSGDPAPPFDAFISKPVDMRTLSDTLRAFGIEAQPAAVPRG